MSAARPLPPSSVGLENTQIFVRGPDGLWRWCKEVFIWHSGRSVRAQAKHLFEIGMIDAGTLAWLNAQATWA